MAKQFIDVAKEGANDAVTALQDGSSLTLTNDVRVLFDDTQNKADLLIAIERAKDRINELLD